MRLALLLVCLAVAAVSFLLLNGQVFTNTLVSLAALAVAVGICVASVLNRRTSAIGKRRWGTIALLMAVPGIVLVANLPAAYRFQKQFNEKTHQTPAGPPG